MKKKRSLFVALFFLLITVSYGNAHTVYFTADHPNLENLNGFEFDVVDAEINALTLTIYYTNDSVLGSTGAVTNIAPNYPWAITPTTDGVYGWDNSAGMYPLVPGVVLSLTGDSLFTLNNFLFADSDNQSGQFTYPFTIAQSDFADAKVYNFSAVPIPGALLLFGSGLIGIVGVRRKLGKS